MTPEEQAAADAAKKQADADAKAKIEELKKAGAKIYSDEEMNEAIARRQEALEKVRALEAAEESRKKAAMTEQERITAELAEQKKIAADLKLKADKADAYEKARKDALKVSLGDKWEPEFETMELSLLEKVSAKLIAAQPNPTQPTRPGQSSALPNNYEEALKDSNKMLELMKNPALFAQMKKDYYTKKGLPTP